jgi:uncharacterized repeat protein (TIGR01451 family)
MRPVHAHNLDTTATSISFEQAFIQTMSNRAVSEPNQPLIRNNDEFWVILKTTPGPGTTTGVGGYQTFYVPTGAVVTDAAYVFPDSSQPSGFRNIPMKGQSPIAIGNGSIASAISTSLIGFDLPGDSVSLHPLVLASKTAPVTASGAHRGTLAGVYADTGIFYSTDPRTAFNSYGMGVGVQSIPPAMRNNSGDTVGEWFAANITNSTTRGVLGVMTLWDSYQLRAYGRADVSPLLDSNGRGNAPWGLANVVAGPQSGYAWEFDYDAYQAFLTANPGDTAGAQRAALKIGPWKRIQYPGSQISSDQPGLISNVLGQAGVDASQIGILPTAIPSDTTAVRFAIGQLELGRPEFSAVKVKITDASTIATCWGMHADAFGGDAGGTEGGKDHIWRYFDPTVVTLKPCTFLQKVPSKSLVAVGETFHYDITFANNGDVALTNITLVDTLPTGVVHVSAVPSPTTLSSPNFTWNIGTVLPNTVVTIRQYVRATGTGTLFNTVTARSGTDIIETAQASVEVGTRAILDKTKRVTPSTAAPGGTVSYTLEIENLGTGPNGTPLRVREFLPAGFTYQSLTSATLNGAAITSPIITVTATNPAEPLFTISQAIQPGQKLLITFVASIHPSVQPGTYWNSFQLEYEGKVVPPIPEAPVVIGGGKIGDTVWRDWNGDGLRDPAEEGIPGVTVQLFAADGTTLLLTTTTDASGNYFFNGLQPGTYVVKVTQPANTIQTYDEDGLGTANQSQVTLALDQQHLTADFGYRPTGTATIGDKVFEDISNDGVFNGSDVGIPNVTVWLYEDSNNNGIIDAGDALVATTGSDGNGDYSFPNLASGFNYLVKVDKTDPDIQTFFNTKYDPDPVPFQLSTPELTSSPNLTGSDLDNDFGFWRVQPGSIGDLVFLDENGNGIFDAGDVPLGGVPVTLLLNGQPFATTTSGPDGSYLFTNLGPGSYTVSVGTTNVPSGYAASAGPYAVTLTAGQNFLTADFPFTPVISKAVDKNYAVTGNQLNYTVNVNYTGSALLENVIVSDFLPAGTTFTSAGQGGQLLTFSPDAAEPGVIGFGDQVPRVYAFQGGSTAFWAYNTASDTWVSPNPAAAPAATGAGAALTNDGFRYVYAFRGAITKTFWRYDAVLNTWAAMAPLPDAAANPGVGAALVHLDGFVYAQLGGATAQFWRYNVATNEWVQRTNASANIGAGGSLATDGENLFSLYGNSTQNFYRFNVAANTWTALATTGQNVADGSGLVFLEDGFFYATFGGTNQIRRYDPEANTWSNNLNSGSNPGAGGSLASDGITMFQTLGAGGNSFVDRRTTGSNVSLANTPGNVTTGGASTFLSSPQGVRTTSLALSGTTVTLGTPLTLTMTVLSTGAVSNVVPSTPQIDGVTASVSAPSPASLNLAANTPGVFTWTVTPTSPGILVATASATGDGGAIFEEGMSNNVLATADGNNQYVRWNLGTNQPPITARTATGNYLYALRGGDTTAFWAYGMPQTAPGTWNNTAPLNDPTDAAVTINTGGAMAGDRERFLYVLQGDGTRDFRRFRTTDGTWDATPADLPAEAALPAAGASAIYLNGFVYVRPGNSTNQFWRYSVAANSWTQMANTPATTLAGGDMATDGTFIYATRGGSTQTFWRYDPATDTWLARANVGRNVAEGGAMTFAKGFVYLLPGASRRTYRYNVATNVWARNTVVSGSRDLPGGNAGAGASLTYDGDDTLYAFRGAGTTGFYRFNLTNQGWDAAATLTQAPANVGAGGEIRYAPYGAVTVGNVTASRSMVRNGNTVTVRLTVTSQDAAGNVTPGTPTFTATGGATATFSSATLISPDAIISGDGDPVIYEWTATVTASSSSIGSIRFNTPYTVGASTATPSTRTIIVVPPLTFVATVAGSPPAVIENISQVDDETHTLFHIPSNITQTATSGSIGDRVWADANLDGVQDAGEFGISGVTVRLYAADGTTLLQTDTTDALGLYRFFGLAAGNYVVRYDTSTAPSGYFATTALSVPVTLTTGQQFNDADFGLFTLPPGTGSIGDLVWLDADNNGVKDAEESVLPNITVRLERLINGQYVQIATTTTDSLGFYEFSGLSAAGYRVTVDPTSQVTSPYAQGTFNLGDVMAPTYDLDSGTTSPDGVTLVTLATDSTVVTTADFGFNWSGSIGDFVWWDYNTDGLQNESPLVGIPNARVQLYFDADFDGVFDRILGDYEILRVFTNPDGSYLIPNLPPGNYYVDVYEDSLVETNGVRNVVPTTADIIPVNLAPGNMNVDTADFGYFEGARVEALVFWDENSNAIRDPSETRLAGITVTLTGTDNFGNPVTRTGTTTSTGYIAFLVPEGNYTISYDPEDLPAGLTTATTPTSVVFQAVAGEDGIRFFDFGVDNSGSIGDTIFADLAPSAGPNGQPGTGDFGLPGVTVNLYLDLNGDGVIDPGDTILATTATDSAGKYLFSGLPDTTGLQKYLVQVLTSTLPSDYDPEPSAYPTGSTLAASTYSTALTGGQAILTVDFGYPLQPGILDTLRSISGKVYNDNGTGGGTASDGLLNGAEPGIANVKVTIEIDADKNGSYEQSFVIFTDSNGNYQFDAIPVGANVRITVDNGTLPSTAFVQTGDPDGGADPISNVWTITDIQTHTNNLNFGYIEQLGSIAGTVVVGNGNGLAETGEPAVAGVTVNLRAAGPDGILGTPDDVLSTTTTNASGAYSFTGLLPGPYEITTNIPQPYLPLADRDGGNTNSINATLTVGQNLTTRDFEYQLGLVLGDRIWLDENSNGLQDAGEDGIANITVRLYAADGITLLATTTTDSNGAYLFTGLANGSYVVKVATTGAGALPAGLAANPTFDLDGTASTHQAFVTLGGGSRYDADFGYNWASLADVTTPGASSTGAIGDRIWIDANGNGIQDANEAGLGGALVQLFHDSNNDGIIDALLATTTSAPDGSYIFDNLPAGIYRVVVTPPTGYIQTGDPDFYGTSVPAGQGDNRTTQPIVLAPGDVFVNADFGYQAIESASISGVVYLDANANTTLSNGEPGIPGVTVILRDNSGAIIATTVTAADGSYTFPGLPNGTFTVEVTDTAYQLRGLSQTGDPDVTVDQKTTVTIANHTSVTDQNFGYVPSGHTGSQGLIGDTIFLDINGDGMQDIGEPGLAGVKVELLSGSTVIASTFTNANGNYWFGNLDDGTYTVRVVTSTLPNGGTGLTNTADPDRGTANESDVIISGGNTDLTQDFGYQAANPNTIAGTIWNDRNADGTLNESGTGLAGITVVLRASNGNIVGTTVTDASGNYSFPGLPNGTYTVDVTDSANLLAGYWKSTGPTPGEDNNSQTDPYTVSVTGGETNSTADFGYYALPASIGNFVWNDLNEDGIQDSGELGIGGVVVQVTITWPNSGGTTILKTLTNVSGFYSFGNLLLDENHDGVGTGEPTFTVSIPTLPGTASPTGAGTPATDSNTPEGTAVTLVQGQYDDSIDFGFYNLQTHTIAGVLYDDRDFDNAFSAPDTRRAGSKVQLYLDLNNDGIADPDELVAETFSDSNGDYSFPNLISGQYIVKVVPALRCIFVNERGEPPLNLGSLTDGQMIVTLSNANNLDNDFLLCRGIFTGAIGDRVWLDENSNGIQDAGEAGIANVTVRLIAADGVTVLATTVTDSEGRYLFPNRNVGSYTVVVDESTLPAGLAANPTYDKDGLGINSVHRTAVTLTAADLKRDVDFGYNWATTADVTAGTGTGAIGDRVWIDSNGNGRQDPGEPGLGGLTVTLFRDSNNDGIIDALLATTTTAADGSYIFDGLAAGIYRVFVNGGTTPAGYTQTGDPDYFQTSVPEAARDNQSTTPIVLGPGDVFVNADFGYQPASSSSVSGVIYLDLNADGNQDPGEPGSLFVSVALLDANGKVIATTMTDANGAYTFTGLPAGSYTVWVNDTYRQLGGRRQTEDQDLLIDGRHTVTANGSTPVTGIDFGYTPSEHRPGKALIGDTVYLDRNGNNSFDPGEGMRGVTVVLLSGSTQIDETLTDANGNYFFGNLEAGTYTVRVLTTTLPGTAGQLTNTVDPDGGTASESVVTIAAEEINLAQDFAYRDLTSPNSITGTLWNDRDADGALEAGESGRYAGVFVVLFDLDGNEIGWTVSAPDGSYAFTGLPDGSYRVGLIDVNHVLFGTWHSLGTAGMAGQSQTDPYSVILTGGQTPVVDFGYYLDPSALGNIVWHDVNANGIQDSGELGIPGIVVELTITWPNSATTVIRTTTDASGFYSFGNLLLDENYDGVGETGEPTYSLRIVTPYPGTASPTGAGTAATDSNNPAGTTATVTQGDFNETYDFGFYALLGAISGFVYDDVNYNGTSFVGIPGVTIELLNADGTTVIATTTTNGSGYYEFLNVPEGVEAYQIRQTQPNDYVSKSDVDGGNLNLIGDVTKVTVVAFQVTAGQNFTEIKQACPDLWSEWHSKWSPDLGGLTGLTQNPDGDRYSNLIEYAFCLPPNSGILNPFCLVPSLGGEDKVDLVFRRTVGAPQDIRYTLQWTATLANPTIWDPDDSEELEAGNTTVTINNDGAEFVRIADLQTFTGLTSGFVRIKVDLLDDQDEIIATDFTEVAGWTSNLLSSNCRTFSAPYVSCPVFSGVVTSVNDQTLNTISGGGIDLGTFLSAAHYIEITSGTHEGQRFEVVSAGVDSFTISTGGLSTSDQVPSGLAGATFVVRTHHTLGSLFRPLTAFAAAGEPALATNLQFYAPGATPWTNYWLTDGVSPSGTWALTGDGALNDRASVIVPPGQGMFLQMPPGFGSATPGDPSNTRFLTFGQVRENAFIRPLKTGANLMGGGFPVDQSATAANGRAMRDIAPTLDNDFVGTTDFKTADQFIIWKGDNARNATGYDTYYLTTLPPAPSGRWVQVGDSTLASKSGATLFFYDRAVFLKVGRDIPKYKMPVPWRADPLPSP